MLRSSRYHNGNGTLALIGHLSEDGSLCEEADQSIDYGIDFYAPQTVLTPDGRRVMIGWLQNWDTASAMREEKLKWFGQMSVPRELSIVDRRLYQKPVRELVARRQNLAAYQNVLIEGARYRSKVRVRMDEVVSITGLATERIQSDINYRLLRERKRIKMQIEPTMRRAGIIHLRM